MAMQLKELLAISLKEHGFDIEKVSETVDKCLVISNQIDTLYHEMRLAKDIYEDKIEMLKKKLAGVRDMCPCPSSARVYDGDPCGRHVCSICGKVH